MALSAWGSFWCFFLNAVSFLPIIFVLGRITKRQQLHEGGGGIVARLREGFRYVRAEPLLMLLLATAGACSLFGYPYLQLMPVLARRLFADEAAGNGYLFGAVGAGALLGALTLSMYTPRRMLATIAATGIASGACLAVVGFAGRPAIAIPLLVVTGVGLVTTIALCNTMIQQRTPDAMRGRVMSMYTFTWFASVPFGNLVAGTLAERQGMATALLVLGGGLVATGMAVMVASSGLRLAWDATPER